MCMVSLVRGDACEFVEGGSATVCGNTVATCAEWYEHGDPNNIAIVTCPQGQHICCEDGQCSPIEDYVVPSRKTGCVLCQVRP